MQRRQDGNDPRVWGGLADRLGQRIVEQVVIGIGGLPASSALTRLRAAPRCATGSNSRNVISRPVATE
jgi:hypothetical protein